MWGEGCVSSIMSQKKGGKRGGIWVPSRVLLIQDVVEFTWSPIVIIKKGKNLV